MATRGHLFNGSYTDENLAHVAFPLGGIGAGMVCLEGTGKLSHVSVRNHPETLTEPLAFAALHVEGHGTRVLEGPTPSWKMFFPWSSTHRGSSGNGGGGRDYGLPRFDRAVFTPRFPFATTRLVAEEWPVDAEICGWSPFLPGQTDDSCLPAAAMEYTLRNNSAETVRGVFSFNSANFMAAESGSSCVDTIKDGFVLREKGTKERPWDEGAFVVVLDESATRVNANWFRGGWFDSLSMIWKELEGGGPVNRPPVGTEEPSPGASVGCSFELGPGEQRTLRLLLAWYVPRSDLVTGKGVVDAKKKPEGYVPWYATRFETVEEIADLWRSEYQRLKTGSLAFRECFFDTTLPPAVVEAVAANLTILKSPTVLRESSGRLWAWEGCCDSEGCCPGSCTHVWNYAQALPHLFPDLERSLRQTEFGEAQTPDGRQSFRAPLPLRAIDHEMVPASDGQLGGIMKVHRDWRVSGDTDWLLMLWPRVRQSLDYCIETWDPDHLGVLVEPHHNTYDIEFWGPDGMCGSFYLGALKAAALMGQALEEDVSLYSELLEKGTRYLEDRLYNGEYFIQDTQWKGLRAGDPAKLKTHRRTGYSSPESLDLLEKEGPKYQYGNGCLSDGVLGEWMAQVCGVGQILDSSKIESHLEAIFRYNFRESMREHANPQRPTYASADEAGLLLCSWPHDDAPSLPFVYSNEVWTGIEYQAASHMMMVGRVEEGLRIVEACRDRYDGRTRNPFNEYECGHWYARAMASYALIQGMTGARYDAIERKLYLEPTIRGDFRAFLSTATGYGTVGVDGGKPFLEVKSGEIAVDAIVYNPREKG